MWFEPWSSLLEGPGSLSFTPIAIARRRCDVLLAMPRDGTFYSPQSPQKLLDRAIEAPLPFTGALYPLKVLA